jgi:hypothetical protein
MGPPRALENNEVNDVKLGGKNWRENETRKFTMKWREHTWRTMKHQKTARREKMAQ